jgi:hypothetical protein
MDEGVQTWTPAISMRKPRTTAREHACARTTCDRICSARMTAARPGRKSRPDWRTQVPRARFGEESQEEGLLFAGSERHVWGSFDDGDHWQTLKLTMASSSVRDLTIHDDDLNRGDPRTRLLDLDDITPLRQIFIRARRLKRPSSSSRRRRCALRWNTNSDTPLPPDEPNLRNPPEGALINY